MVEIERNGHPSHYHVIKGPDGTRELLPHADYFRRKKPAGNTIIDGIRNLSTRVLHNGSGPRRE